MGSILSYFYGYPDDGILDPNVGLTGKEKRLVRETWNTIYANSVNTGVAIMSSYFKQYPQYHKVFPAFKDIPLDELSANMKFKAHCQFIMSTLSNAFNALDDIALMETILQSTGQKHGRRGQGRQEFIDLKGVMMEVMKNDLKSKFSPEVEAAWSKMIDVAFLKIFEGMENR
ncbi:cytoglobin-1-like [Hylaeus anthracinus]|uniref:cytoglobin-1-like n=1 Tax=Hylaeus volcanicus TaxID=313075 RepID=UPI0023B7FE86|nr:cytoglobin-1-like [Hylaeus volcanicus]XP_053975241.1 cytoglobin-1-like [Hylaeus volcanicus]XP_053975242.1 cytoglobin-1-like [Hylaeus volcanicus]XP_054000705.1 cytoglobin-1-like [Hylaeus anthracinus]XP_054000706.1 cytoglobin-1-like [Hylaeus anthracinus]XP_054000707.1 cytoglobin-1-like [Hylaeus anthracinus]